MTRQFVPFDEIMDRPLALNDTMQGQRKKTRSAERRARNGPSTRHVVKSMDCEVADADDQELPRSPEPRARRRRRDSTKPPARPHILTSAEHTNVTCRFIVRASSDLTPKRINVNTPIPLSQVIRIVAPAQECPICLERAEVPRMLGCGHVMCLPCMIKHRRYSPQATICPICGELVSLGGSRTTPVTFLETDERFLPHEGGEVVLTLMFRPKESSVALPVNVVPELAISETHFPSPEMSLWSRVCEGSLEYAKQELAREIKVLLGARKQALEDFGDDEGYTEAVADIKQVIHTLQNEKDSLPAKKKRNGNTSAQAHSRSKPGSGPEGSYFYQAGFESPTVFTLSQLDVSMLKAAYGSFSQFPTSLIAKVENIIYTSSDSTTDKRQKYLSHLPNQTALAIMECDWNEVLPAAVLAKFEAKLTERRSKKVSKEVREEAERQQAQEAIDLQFRSEIAEAMVPHEGVGFTTAAGLDMSLLPSLPTNNKNTDSRNQRRSQVTESESRDGHTEGNVEKTQPRPEPPRWVDPRRDYDELMRNAYVPERGRKHIYLRF